ncbi:MAG: NmrA family NAD(P)-binding protein [Terricaulis sp.]
MTDAPILVTGATGAQGGAVVRAALNNGMLVRALVRDAASPNALVLAEAGVALAQGSFDDAASLAAAADGAAAVFSVQLYNPSKPEAERAHAQALANAARAANVPTFVQASVSGVDDRHRWRGGEWDDVYWDNKATVEDIALSAGFQNAIVLRPAFMMENFVSPKAERMFPDLAERRIVTVVRDDTAIALVTAEDVGQAAGAAIAEPAQFNGRAVELAGDALTLPQIAALLGADIEVQTNTPEIEIGRGRSAGWVLSQQWLNAFGYPARPSDMRTFGLQPTTFAEWLATRASPMR